MSSVTNKVVQPGVLETIKETLHLDTAMEKLNVSKSMLVDIGIFGAIGFLTGFLVKKYNNVIISFLLFLLGLGVIHHLGFVAITIHWVALQEALGLGTDFIIADTSWEIIWTIILSNKVGSVSFAVGLLLGLKTA